jgi:O-antigen/teichoic acid export membrane protein
MNNMATLRASFAWQTLSSLTNLLLGVVQISILARLFDASQFGALAIVMVVVNICQIFSDLGMSNYILHRQDSNSMTSIKSLNSTLFICGLVASLLLTVVMAVFIPVVTYFYDYPNLSYYLSISMSIFILIGVSSQLQACYIKYGFINTLAKIEIVARIIGFIISITMAYAGFGIEVFIFGTIAFQFTKSVLLFVCSNANWRPSWDFNQDEAKKAWSYGIYQVGSQLINQIRMNLDVLCLGLFVSTSALGFYSLAKQLVSKPAAIINPIVSRIALNLFAHHQRNETLFKSCVMKIHQINVVALSITYGLLGYWALEVIELFYGMKNSQASLYLVPLCLFWSIRYIAGGLVGPLVQVLGKTKLDFYWNLATLGLFSIALFISAQQGALVLAYAMAVIQLILMVFVYKVFIKNFTEISIVDFFRPILVSVLSMSCTVYVCDWFISLMTSYFNLNQTIHMMLSSALAILVLVLINKNTIYTILKGEQE